MASRKNLIGLGDLHSENWGRLFRGNVTQACRVNHPACSCINAVATVSAGSALAMTLGDINRGMLKGKLKGGFFTWNIDAESVLTLRHHKQNVSFALGSMEMLSWEVLCASGVSPSADTCHQFKGIEEEYMCIRFNS